MLAIKARTFVALGLDNVARVAAYRIGLKTGLSRVQRLKAAAASGPFFVRTAARDKHPVPSEAWKGEAIYFGSHRVDRHRDAPPDWFLNPYTGKSLPAAERHWWQIPDFDPGFGDIKIVWEASRFDWLIAAAQRAASGDDAAWAQIEAWLADWCAKNPPYRGPNWKCGQEASIRVMHLAMASLVLGNADRPTKGLVNLVEAHLRRIEPTVQYAIGQDNNHGTSEAAALFIGGSWLEKVDRPGAKRWTRLGRRLISNRIERLVAPDGSFSQYSLTYHRVLLDTMVMVEAWRRRSKLPDFPAPVRERLARAAEWLFALIDPEGGDGPNLGSNDGARLLPLTDTGYRDFRPTVQASMALFCNQRGYTARGPWDAPLVWLGLEAPATVATPPTSTQFDDGGYAILRNESATALLRYPRFRFRPAQADALHVDLWVGSDNLLRDSGTYSYNTDPATLDRFSGVAGHNTVMFDGRDQMPRLGRFLFGEWLRAENVAFDARANEASAGYTDWRGANHHRAIHLLSNKLIVTDQLSGRFEKAVLRWHLMPGEWRIEGNAITDGSRSIAITTDARVRRLELVTGEESLHYLERHPIPILEVEIGEAGAITSEIYWL